MPDPLETVGQDIADGVFPHLDLDAENNDAGHHLIAAIGAMWQDVDDLIRDTTDGAPGWSVLIDVDRAPDWALPWLGQLAGVQVTAGKSEAFQRAEVRRADGQRRGTVATIVDTIVPFLDAPKRALLTERFDPDNPGDQAYHVTARVRYADLPVGDEAETIASITARFFAALPAGIIGHIVFTDERTYAEALIEFPTYTDVDVGNANYFELLNLEP